MREITDASRAQSFIEKDELLRLFEAIEPDLYRYPSLDPPSFRQAVERFLS